MKTNIHCGQHISYTWFHSKACYLFCVRQLFWDTCMKMLQTIKLPNLDQTPLYFVMALVSRDVAGIPCVWFNQGGRESRGRERKRTTEKVRMYFNHIPAEYMENFEVRKSSTFTILRHQGTHCSHHLWCIYLWKNRHNT